MDQLTVMGERPVVVEIINSSTGAVESCAVLECNGEVIWRAEISLADLSIALDGGPGTVTGTQYFVSDAAWDLSGVMVLTGTVASDATVRYWTSPYGTVNSTSAAAYLQLADGTRVALGTGAVRVDLSGYTDAQKAHVQLCGSLAWDISTVTNAAFAGAGWSITGAVGSYSSTASYTNRLPLAVNTDGSVYNGTGYRDGYRLGSGGTDTNYDGYAVTGYIPCSLGDVIRLANIAFVSGDSNQRISFYAADFTHMAQTNGTAAGELLAAVFGSDGNMSQFTVQGFDSYDLTDVAYFRLCGTYIGADSVITVNEAI